MAARPATVFTITSNFRKEMHYRTLDENVDIVPGAILTPMTSAIPENIRAEKASKFPTKRWGEPREVANVYAFLASDEASYVNATAVTVDGGFL